MTDAVTSAPSRKLPYVNSYRDPRNGKMRHAFRRKGHRTVMIKGDPGSPEFTAHYQELLDRELLPPASTLRGGVRAKRGVEPLIGVYLLLLRGKVAYVGSSLRMPSRVAEHRKNGRPFDEVHYIATKANERERLEAILIKALHPVQNKVHRAVTGTANGARALDQDEAHVDL